MRVTSVGVGGGEGGAGRWGRKLEREVHWGEAVSVLEDEGEARDEGKV